jgi:hypothetical protein
VATVSEEQFEPVKQRLGFRVLVANKHVHVSGSSEEQATHLRSNGAVLMPGQHIPHKEAYKLRDLLGCKA